MQEDQESVAKPLGLLLATYGMRASHVPIGSLVNRGSSPVAPDSLNGSTAVFVILVLSVHTVAAARTLHELGAFFTQQPAQPILIVRHGLAVEEAAKALGILGDRISTSTDRGLDEAVAALLPVLAPGHAIKHRLSARNDLDLLLPPLFLEARNESNKVLSEGFSRIPQDSRFALQRRFSHGHLAYYGISVSILKRALATLGYYGDHISEEFTPGLASALERFQRDRGDPYPHGISGTQTLNWLATALEAGEENELRVPWNVDLGVATSPPADQLRWDVFISYASEDRETVAEPLARSLSSYGISVWYDAFALSVGDYLLASINNGLKRSRYGIVILSAAFCIKHWPQRELGGLFARESAGEKLILPVRHQLSPEAVIQWMPMLGDRVSISTDSGIERMVAELLPVFSAGKVIARGLGAVEESDKLLPAEYVIARRLSNIVFAEIFSRASKADRFPQQQRLTKRHLANYGIPVSILKRGLREVGCFSGTISEDFTEDLVAAIEAFQLSCNAPHPDGIAGTNTLRLLAARL